MKINDVAVTEKSYLELSRSTTGTEQMQVMEWLIIAHIDSTQPLPQERGLMMVDIPKERLFRWGLCSPVNLQRDLERLAKNIGQLQFFMVKGKKWVWATAFPLLEYLPDSECVRVGVIGHLAPKLTEIKNNFRQFELPILFDELNGVYTRKLYLQFRNSLHHNSYSTQLELTFGELKDRLGIQKGRWSVWKEFNSKILKPAFKEMQQADIDVSVKLLAKRAKPGRTDEKRLVFIVTHRERQSRSLEISPKLSKLSDWSHDYLRSIGFNRPQMFEKLSNEHGSEVVENALKNFAKTMSSTDPARINISGILNNRFFLYLDKVLMSRKREKEMNKLVKDKEVAKAAAQAAEQAEEVKDLEAFAKWKVDCSAEFEKRMREKREQMPVANDILESWVFGEWRQETVLEPV